MKPRRCELLRKAKELLISETEQRQRLAEERHLRRIQHVEERTTYYRYLKT